MTKDNRIAGEKPDAPTDRRPDPPPAPPRPRMMEIAQQLIEESKSTDGLAKAIILEAVAKLCLASTLLDGKE